MRYATRVAITRVNHRKTGNDLVIKSISTGTVTRMGLDKAGLTFFCIMVLILFEIILSKVSLLQNKYFLSVTSFHCLQVSFIRSCGKCSPHKCYYQKYSL